jgi:hypothetical protein
MLEAHPDRERLRAMFNERFVCATITAGEPIKCWGIMFEQLGDFVPLWTETADEWQAVMEELGQLLSTGLMDGEVKTAVEATEHNTPPEAWVALAYYRLTGERLERPSDFVKE